MLIYHGQASLRARSNLLALQPFQVLRRDLIHTYIHGEKDVLRKVAGVSNNEKMLEATS